MAAEQLLHFVRKLYFAALIRHLKYVQLKGVRTEHLFCSRTSLDIQIDRLVVTPYCIDIFYGDINKHKSIHRKLQRLLFDHIRRPQYSTVTWFLLYSFTIFSFLTIRIHPSSSIHFAMVVN